MLQSFWKKITQAPKFENEDKTQKAQLIYYLTFILSVVIVILIFISSYRNINLVFTGSMVFILIIVAFARATIRKGQINFAVWILAFSGLLSITANSAFLGGFRYIGRFGFIIPIIVASIIIGRQGTIALSLSTLISGFLIFILDSNDMLPDVLPDKVSTNEFNIFTILVLFVTGLLYYYNTMLDRAKENQRISLEEVKTYSEQLTNSFAELDMTRQELANQNELFRKRTQYLEASSQVAQTSSSITDPNLIIEKSVHIISQWLGFYQVGVFLLNEKADWALLKAASSDGGKRMIARDHKLRVGAEGIVGFVTSTGQPRIVQATVADEIHRKTMELPDTRAEMAVPLKNSDGKVFGALDVQSTVENAFSQDDIDSLNIISNQISIALSNATLFQNSQKQLESMQRAFGIITLESWHEFIQTKDQVYSYDQFKGVSTTSSKKRKVVQKSDTVFSAPIYARDILVGYIDFEMGTPYKTLDNDTKDVISSISEQLGFALENALLYYETTTQVANEQLSASLSTKIRENMNVNEILRNTVDELKSTMKYSNVTLQLVDNQSENLTEPKL